MSAKIMKESTKSTTVIQTNARRLYTVLQFKIQNTKRNSDGFPKWVKLELPFCNQSAG